MNKALIGAGCFWGIEEYYRKLNGILNTKVGYSGGHLNNPTYEDVCTGTTEHVEVLNIEFNNSIISYKEILGHFWKCHDPTTLNQQGPDFGRQYRSAIFYFDNTQKEEAENSKDENQILINKPIVTEITLAKEFFLAEEYHQLYIKKRS